MSKILQKVLRYSYCRKSQEDDSRQVLSLPAQNQAVRDIWVRQNATCDEIFEEAKSAKVPGRKLLNKMLDSIEECGAGEIACWKLDRLARNFIDGGRIIDMIQRGVIRAIHTYEKTYLPTDNVLMMAVEFGMANQFIRDLSTNTKRGLRAKIAAGQPPRAAVVGYKNNLSTHNWEIDPYYAPIVCQIFEWYDTGLYSELDIVEKLKEAGILTKKGKQFHKSTIGRMLRDPAYYGYFYANGELYRGTYEPIINKELWDRVQDRINGRVTYNHKKGKLVFNYKGIMHCFECGCEVTAEYQHQCICTNCKKKSKRILMTADKLLESFRSCEFHIDHPGIG
jgi:DNA invertase Pin-like site-specific DNA recombinase